MITIDDQSNKFESICFEFRGLADDEKPITTYGGSNIANGSVFLEMDTGKIYFYDLENATWVSGEGGDNVVIATVINASSTNDDAAGAKAVYDFVTQNAEETILLEGDASWLAGSTYTFSDEEEIAKLNHYEELITAGKHPRIGFTLSGLGGGDSVAAKEADDIFVIEGTAFTCFFTVYLGTYGFYGVTISKVSDTWTLVATSLLS